MSRDDEYYGPPDDLPIEDILFGLHGQYLQDDRAFNLFDKAFFDKDERAYRDLVDYMWDQYGIDFEDAFDWEDFRAWYESTQ